MPENIQVIEEHGQVARGLSVIVRIAWPVDGVAVLTVALDPSPPARLRGAGLDAFREVRNRALDRVAEVAGHDVETVLR